MKQPFGENLIAGDSWNWRVILEDDVPAGSKLKYFFRGILEGQTLDLSADLSGDGSFSFISASADTKKFAGTVSWGCYLYDAQDNRTELARGSVTVLPDIESAAVGFDGRSWAKRMLDAVTAMLENRASRVEKEYQIGSRHVGLMEPSELLKLKADLESIYDKELVKAGQKKPGSNQVRVAFGSKSSAGVWR